VNPEQAWCSEGEAADQLLAAGDVARADAAYATLWAKVRASGTLDAFIVSKIVLGMLCCKTLLRSFRDAHALWTMELRDGNGLGVGVYGLENGQTHEHDTGIYLMVSAALHAQNGDREEAQLGVDKGLRTVVELADGAGDVVMRELALSNWHHHLVEIHEQDPPPAHATKELGAAQGSRPAPRRPLAFPRPRAWVVDWGDGAATEFHPSGDVRRVEPEPPPKRGFFARLFGRS
jgi:hypothetical protein